MWKVRESQGIKEKSEEEKRYIDPETRNTYEQMYRLPDQSFPEAAQPLNPASIKTHYGSS